MMEVISQYEYDGLGLYYQVKGSLNGPELLARTAVMYTPDVIAKLRYQIGDLRFVERIDITMEQMQQIALLDKRAAEAAKGFKIAIVASHDLLSALGNMYRLYMDSHWVETRVFQSTDSARVWINSLLASGELAATVNDEHLALDTQQQTIIIG